MPKEDGQSESAFHGDNMTAHAAFATVNNGQIAYELAGQGEPVVLIHGFTLDMSMWNDQMPPLREHFSVLRYDARGFGQSSLPHGLYTHHDDLNALLDILEIESAHVVGLSMGGSIALRFACIYPQRVRSLSIVDGTLPGYAASDETAPQLSPVHGTARSRGLAAAREAWLAHPIFEAADEQPDVAARLRVMVDRYSGWHWLNDDSAIEIDPPVAARLHQLKAPTLVVVGQRDIAEYQTFARRMAEDIPGAKLAVIPGAGHMSNMEAPNAFNQLLLDFLRLHRDR